MVFDAYLDPSLRHRVSIDGTWSKPLEIVMGAARTMTARFWVHSQQARSYVFEWVPIKLEHYVITLPQTVLIKPGVNAIDLSIECTKVVAPVTEDFTIRFTKPQATEITAYGFGSDAGYDVSFASWGAYAAGINAPGADEFRIEMSAFFLESGDARYPGLVKTPLDSPDDLANYAASGMGWIPVDFFETDVKILTRMIYSHALWGQNKRQFLDPRYGPLRVITNRPDALDYRPPGLELYPPNIRRAVLSRAGVLAGSIGTRRAIIDSFIALGVNIKELIVYHDVEQHVWVVKIPKTAISFFSPDFLGQFALYHVDGYEGVLLDVLDDDTRYLYTGIDYTNLTFIG